MWADDVREGDQIRVVIEVGESISFQYEAEHDGDDGGVAGSAVSRYLVRRSPAVDLPTEPTLGWLTSKYGGSVLGTWERQRLTGGPGVSVTRSGMRALLPEITGFTRAVAVPAVALDDLRSGVINDFDAAVRLIADFLAAVDKANGGDQS